MADGLVKDFAAVVKPVVQFCLDNDINIMQMPCPETLCASGGIGRTPHGKAWYEANGLRATAREIAKGQVRYMSTLLAGGVDVLGIIGVDFSPACAVNYLNKGRSIRRDKGIYVEELQKCMEEHGLNVRLVGIRQNWGTKMKADLEQLLQ
jgi:predicted secreted protein